MFLTSQSMILETPQERFNHDITTKTDTYFKCQPDENDIFLVDNNKIKLLTLEIIHKYISTICQKMKIEHLEIDKITKNVYPKLKQKNTIKELEDQIIMCASEMVTDHYDYPCIATWILINNLHENTYDDYLKVIKQLRSNANKKGRKAPIVSKDFANFVKKYHKEINSALKYERDYDISIFGYRTLEKSYLKKLADGKIVERPQHMYMRVAIALHYRTNRLDKIFETYELLSTGYFTHATPTLFNAGAIYEQLSSCFLLGIDDDMKAIGESWKDCAIISKYAGGIGINVTNIRVDGAYIHSTQGVASGMRLLTVFNQIARYADQGGKRSGSIAIYLEPWHGDIFFFLDLKKNTGAETERARDLFLALMVNDIFMKRVEENGIWSLMCPSECPNLLNKYGEEFTKIYEKYEANGNFLKQVPARDVWFKIMESQIESGVPYIVFKDAVNYKSNQINIGVINGSNLCVSGDTMILTSEGYQNIKSVENQKIEVWNGEEFSEVIVRKTGTNKRLIQIEFSNGSILKCTPYHKFYITIKNVTVQKQASELQVGDYLIDTKYPTIEKKIEEFNKFIDSYNGYISIESGKLMIGPDKFNDLNKIKYILQTMGCDPDLCRIYAEKYMLVIDYNDVGNLLDLGLSTKKINLDFFSKSFNSNKRKIMITDISDVDGRHETYCFTEPKRGMGIFNGIIAGNCAEIVEVSSANEYSVCNLASICLPKYVKTINGKTIFDYQELFHVVRVVTRNLDNIIDINFYPIDKTKISNLKHRPIGVGVQGLADVFALFKTAFDSDIARDLNKKIFETIYFGALTESMEIAKEKGPYEMFNGSPLSQGKFQFDLWGLDRNKLSGIWDWDFLMQQIITYGVRNSLVTTCMPTASTSQIMGNNETMEPYTENIYTRNTMAGDFYVINKHLMKDLMELGLWNSDMVDLIKYYKGSINNIPGIPENIKEIYRTVWEIPQKSIIDMAADRGPFIDQTQSMNLFIATASFARLNTCLFYAWKKGLKTGMYYLRSKAASEANQFGIDIDKIKELEIKYHISQDVSINIPLCKIIPKHLRKPGDCNICGS